MAKHAAAVLAPDTMLLPVYSEGDAQAHAGTLLGREAVRHAKLATAYHHNSEYYEAAGDDALAAETAAHAERYGLQTLELLDNVRDRLQGKVENREELHDYVERFIGEEFDDSRASGATHYTDILSWLGGGHKEGASDAQLYTFLKRHVEHIEHQQQSPQVKEVIAKTKEQFITSMRYAAHQGWVSPRALDNLEYINDVKIVIGDIWDTFVEGNSGYFTDGKPYVVIGQGKDLGNREGEILENIREVAPHEFCHVLFDDGRDLPEWFIESMAEHLTLVLATGRPDAIDPQWRRDNGSYVAYREMMGGMLTSTRRGLWGNDVNLVRAAMHAYTSPVGSAEWQRFLTLMDEEWGSNGFDVFAQLMERQANYLQKTNGKYRDDPRRAEFAAARAITFKMPELRTRARGGRPDTYRPRHNSHRKQKPQHHIGAAAVGKKR